jgi:hypothetical protein
MLKRKLTGHKKTLPSKLANIHLVAGCVHMPAHNKLLWNAFLKLVKDLRPRLRGIHLIGDILDMHSISRHAKGKITVEGLTLEKEYREANKELDCLDAAIGNLKITKTYFWGNHEDWYNQNLQFTDSYKLGRGVILSPTEALCLKKRGYNVHENFRDASTVVGDITLIHGEYLNTHTAKKHLDVMKRNVMFVHTHGMQEYSESGLTAYNIGWMGDSTNSVFGYTGKYHKMRWTNGFAVVVVDDKGTSHVQIIRWKNDRFFYNGKEYS